MGKINLLAGTCLVVVAGLSLTTQSAMDRFKSLVRSSDEMPESAAEASAMASTRSRAELLRRSLVQTARHPLFGVGAGMFMVSDNNDSILELSRQGLWHVSHNGYTQLSSETGIPGALVYIAAMYLCFRKLRAVEKASRKIASLAAVSDMAFALRLALIAYAFELCFTSSAYECYFPILAALTASFELAARSEIRAVHDVAVAATPTVPAGWAARAAARRATS
jgi:O-antigen ligase